MYRTRSISMKLLTLFVAMALMLPSFALSPSTVMAEKSIQEMQRDIDRLKKDASDLNKKIANQEKKKTDEQAYLNAINKQIENAKEQISLLDRQISSLNNNIAKLNENISRKEADISEKEAEIALQQKTLGKRLRAVSKSGNMSEIQMLLSTDDYTDYLVKSKVMERLSNSSQEMVDKLNDDITALNEQKDSLQKDKKEVAEKLSSVKTLKSESTAKKRELDTLYAKSNAAIKSISKDIRNFEEDRAKVKAEIAEYQKLIDEINRSKSAGKFTEGTMLWPVPTVRNVSSYYGMRWGRLHRGIDIANGSIPIYGENIIAAADGVVVTATRGNSYGNYITINHGANSKGVVISTLYAHLSAILVRSGQTVKAGDVIGRAGDTGNVTGPHLHFEVHENGTAVNPIAKGYVRKS